MNRVLANLAEHPSKRAHDLLRRRDNVVDLTVGMPDYGPPPAFAETVARLARGSSAVHRYSDSRGCVDLRETLAARLKRRNGVQVDPEAQLLICNGASQAIALTILVASEPGDDILLFDPAYPLYATQATILGRRPVRVRCDPQAGFTVDLEAVERLCTDRTTLMIVTSPNNPTGTVLGPSPLAELSRIAERHGCYILHDEVLENFVYDGQHYSLLGYGPYDRTISVSSVSKSLGMSGWRVGWMGGPRAVIDAAARAHTYIELAVNHLAQQALAELLNAPGFDQLLEERRAIMARRLKMARHSLAEIDGIELEMEVNAGFYLFPRVTGVMEKLGVLHDTELCHALVDRAEVAVVPGSAFGPTGSGHVRISIAGPEDELARALDSLARLLGDSG